MKRYIKSDINSYTQYRDNSDEIVLANYEDQNGYVTLSEDSFTLIVDSGVYGSTSDNADFYAEYSLKDPENAKSSIDSAIHDFNECIKKLGGKWRLTRRFIDQVLSEYGTSLADYELGGFYDKCRIDDRIMSNSQISCATFARNDMASRIKRNPTDEEVAIVDDAKDYLDSCKAAFESAQNAYQFARRTSKCSDEECSDLYDKLMKTHDDYIDAERKYMDLWDEYMGYSYY